MIPVLVIGSVEDAELLRAMRGIVGGIDVQQDLAVLANRLATETNELVEQDVVQPHQVAGGRRILAGAQSGLRTERLTQLLVRNDL
jgi:hypothetical protein